MAAEHIYTGDIAPGSSGPRARLAQEWLCLNGFNVAVDGEFGPASKLATQSFQKAKGLSQTGTVDKATFEALVKPMVNALQPITPNVGDTIGRLAVEYAKQHLAQHPREVGGQNMGPWVRMYMDGNQGAQWPWCAGFASFVLKQAAMRLGKPMPVKASFSCDLLAANATGAGCFAACSVDLKPPGKLTPGSLFLVRRTVGDWEHVGFVIEVTPDAFHTIEGNTNDDGDREGYEVCRRVRGYKDKDFILIE
jgi:hypothetical protein